jgi:hypothetical protein
LGLASAGGVAAAVAAVAIAVGLGDGGSAPTVSLSQAAASTPRAATLPAPPESQAHHAQLAVAVDGLPFPYWSERFGWRSTGSRTDRVDGRSITTVFYANSSGQRIGYAILAGNPSPRIGGGVIAWRGGVSYRLLTENGTAVVTWLRDDHLCVVSGRGASSDAATAGELERSRRDRLLSAHDRRPGSGEEEQGTPVLGKVRGVAVSIGRR